MENNESRATPPASEIVPENVQRMIDAILAWPEMYQGYGLELAQWVQDTRFKTPPASEIVPEGTAPRNPNLLFHEYESDLLFAAAKLDDASMPNAAKRVRYLATLLAKTKPQKEAPNAQG